MSELNGSTGMCCPKCLWGDTRVRVSQRFRRQFGLHSTTVKSFISNRSPLETHLLSCRLEERSDPLVGKGDPKRERSQRVDRGRNVGERSSVLKWERKKILGYVSGRS